MTRKIQESRFSVLETENTITLGAAAWDSNFRDRLNYDRQKILGDAITAWRSNPIARRIIEVTTEFVIGDGFTFTAPKNVEKLLRDFWHHPLNNLDEQLPEWADEAWRTGDLFLLVSLDPGGGVYVRALPSESINVIETAANDYRQETFYKRNAMDENPWPARNGVEPFSGTPATSRSIPEEGRVAGADVPSPFILHFPLNRAVGATFGESDLVPVLHWIGLYRQWLEDRATLNTFRQMFSLVLTRPFANQPEKEKYMRDFIAKFPKKSGAIVGLDPNESLSVINPNLSSIEAEADGLALKRMIAAGAGIPLHYLAEPESSTRTTAEASGAPAFKRFRQRQMFLANALRTLLETVVAIHAKTYPNWMRRPARSGASSPTSPHRRLVSSMPEPGIRILTPDISEKDNASLAIAAQRIVTAFAPLYNAKLIEPQEFIRLVYRFVAEGMPEKVGDFTPVNVRGGKLPNTDTSEAPKGDTNV